MSNKIKRLIGLKKQRTTEKKRPLLATMTGEPLQLARIHYDLLGEQEVERTFSRLKCMDFDPLQKRWTWNYHEEAKKLKFQSPYDAIPKEHRPIAIGSFYFRVTEQRMYLDVNSFDRAIAAIQFFDTHLNRDVASLSHIQVVNKFFEAVPGMIPRQNDYFDPGLPERPDDKSGFEELAADKTLKRNEDGVVSTKNGC